MYQFAGDTCVMVASNNLTEALKLPHLDFAMLTKSSHDVGLVLNAV